MEGNKITYLKISKLGLQKYLLSMIIYLIQLNNFA